MNKSIKIMAALSLVLFASMAAATMIVRVPFNKLVKDADVAFHGVCMDRKAYVLEDKKFPEGLLVTKYNFKIIRTLKGDVDEGQNFEFSQLGAPDAEARRVWQEKGRIIPQASEVPSYEVGKDYILFLTPQSDIGLRSPIGLPVGVARVSKDSQGKSVVKSPYLKELYKSTPATKSMSGNVKKSAIGYDDFIKSVEDVKKEIK